MIQSRKAFSCGTLVIAATTSCAQGQDFPLMLETDAASQKQLKISRFL